MIRWIIIILAVLGIGAGGYYYIYLRPAGETPSGGGYESAALQEGETAALEAELDATATEGLDAELDDIDRELAQ